ncbi:hypothetical protein [Inquilinus sp. OTU3971]|uniref:hypothetical protein n=1 Tax=Inquilinus sp. OTU3971 TaxID=3043855 RepID=UPI00313B9880
MDFTCESGRAATIDRLQSQLATELDPDRRYFYFKLMIAEEDKFGKIEEQIDIVRAKVRRINLLVEKQKYILSRIEQTGRDRRVANDILEALIHAEILLEGRLDQLLRNRI